MIRMGIWGVGVTMVVVVTVGMIVAVAMGVVMA